MLKPMLLATSMMFAIPAFAQETPAQDNTQPTQSAPVQEQATPPATSDDKAPGTQDQTMTAEATPAPVEPTTQPTQPAQGVAQDSGTATPAQPSAPAAVASTEPVAAPAEQPAATQEQVAQAVGRDFGSYDKNADGKLDATEFAAWMGSLRKAAEPSFEPGSAEATAWANQAFASADTDKSASVNKQELTVFLTPKQPS